MDVKHFKTNVQLFFSFILLMLQTPSMHDTIYSSWQQIALLKRFSECTGHNNLAAIVYLQKRTGAHLLPSLCPQKKSNKLLTMISKNLSIFQISSNLLLITSPPHAPKHHYAFPFTKPSCSILYLRYLMLEWTLLQIMPGNRGVSQEETGTCELWRVALPMEVWVLLNKVIK